MASTWNPRPIRHRPYVDAPPHRSPLRHRALSWPSPAPPARLPPGQAELRWDWMACTSIIDDAGLPATGYPLGVQLGVPTVVAPNSPYAEGSTPIYRGLIVDPYGVGIPYSAMSALTLTIADVLTGAIINGCDQADILNVGRGSIDALGNLQIALEAGDTSLSEAPGVSQIERALIIDWTYATTGPQASSGSGRHQVNFTVQALAGP